MAEEGWEMTVNKDGKIEKLEVKGGDGKTCLLETAGLEKLLGTVTNRQMKPEAHNKTTSAAEKVKVGK